MFLETNLSFFKEDEIIQPRAIQSSQRYGRFDSLLTCRKRLSPHELRGLYRRACDIAADFKNKEIELIEILKEMDATKAFRISGMNSLFSFVTEILKLSEHQALTYITIARKCAEVPEIQNALFAKEISVSKARRICSVIDDSNKHEWIELAKKSTQKELEKAIRLKDPKALVYDSMRYLTHEYLSLEATIDEDTSQKIKRVKELMTESQNKRIDYNEMFKGLAEVYLQKFDPVLKAERLLNKSAHGSQAKVPKDKFQNQNGNDGLKSPNRLVNKRVPLTAETKHFIFKRDNGQCRFHINGQRCTSRIHLEVHHKLPIAKGGTDAIENLVLLCSSHHKSIHDHFMA